jgi:FkbM family methyltransferase
MDKKEFLIFPWDGFKNAVNIFKSGWQNYLSKQVNYLELDMRTRKYNYIKEGERIGPKQVKSLEYVLIHWPKKRHKSVAIQAGGCLGLWPKVLSNSFDWVYTFEPQAQSFFFLSLNCPEENIIKLQMALGAGSDSVRAKMTNRPGRCEVTPGGFVPMIAIDSLKMSFCDAILLDAEGYEFNILKGAIKTINKFRPFILCEDWNDKNVEDFMNDNDYELITKINKDNIYKHKQTAWDI